MSLVKPPSIDDYMDGLPTTGDLTDEAANTPLNTGGINFGNILKGAIGKGLDALLDRDWETVIQPLF